MQRRFQTAMQQICLSILVAVTFFAVLAICSNQRTFAQEATKGEWTAEIDDKKPDKLQLTFKRRTAKGGNNTHGNGYSFSDLQGLNRQQASGSGAVNFSLVREAGTIECAGKFESGKGTGTFVFTPNQNFVSAMQSRGFAFNEDKLFTAAALNLTVAFTDDLLSQKFGELDIEDLFKAIIFKITPQFASEMKASGFPNLGMEELVKARIFKIDAGFVKQVVAMGFDKEPFESLVKMRIFKITPEFITEVRSEGLTNLDVEDIVKLRIFKIDGAFIRQARADGVPLEVEKLVQKRIGVWGK